MLTLTLITTHLTVITFWLWRSSCRTSLTRGRSLMMRVDVQPILAYLSYGNCYVGLIAVGVQEQAEDILVPPLPRNCLTLLTLFSFS